MRTAIGATVLGVACMLVACGGRPTAWTTLAARDVPDGSDAFVLIGANALHLAHVQQVDGHLQGRIVHGWAIPRAGVAALADDTTTTSPEEVAHRAGWTELHITNAALDVPISVVRSARATVGIEQDPADNDSDHPLLFAVVTGLLEIALEPRCCHHAFLSGC